MCVCVCVHMGDGQSVSQYEGPTTDLKKQTI